MDRLANYHTHTFRCNHASGTDEDYVLRAIDQGLGTLGFSDHTPWPYTEDDYTTHMRMAQNELPLYVKSIRDLKERYRDRIDIQIGLEAEHFPQYTAWLEDRVNELGIEYLILGQHYSGNSERFYYYGAENDVRGMRYFVDLLPKAIESGLYRYVAHPDLVFCQYPSFDENCRSASRDILDIVRELDMPIEYNVSGTWKRFRGMGYPCPGFWEMAAGTGVKVYLGFDAHEPGKIQRKLFTDSAEHLRGLGMEVQNA